MSAPGLAELRKRAVPGRCLCCSDLARPRSVLCGRSACLRAYNRAWHVDARKAHPERYGDRFYRARGTKRPTPEETREKRRAEALHRARNNSRSTNRGDGHRGLGPSVSGTRGGGYFNVDAVPLLPPTGESYSDFCRRVERGWTAASR